MTNAAVAEAVKMLEWAADSYDAHAKCTDVPDEIDGYIGSAEMMRNAAVGLAAALAAPAEGWRDIASEVVKAWEALPGDRHQPAGAVERWLAADMAPVINKIRAALPSAPSGEQTR